MIPDGNILISARHTNAVYELNHQTAQIKWRLGGKRSDFDLTQAAGFIGQHDARLQPDGSITLYDNGGPTGPERESRALWLNVDEVHRKVTVRHSYHYKHTIKAFSQGGMQVLPNHDVFVGWGGNQPYFTEFTAGGTIVWDAHFDPKGDDSYRAYRLPWSAQPAAKPDVAAIRSSGKIKIYASWNGATDVAKWRVIVDGKPGKTFSRKGFESSTTIDGPASQIQVRALGSGGETLADSDPVTPSG
jgi:hypothetical protein